MKPTTVTVATFLALASAACGATDGGISVESLDLDKSDGGDAASKPPPPPKDSCFWDVATAKTCTGDKTFEQIAETTCSKKGDVVRAWQGDESCGADVSLELKFECCPPPPPPPSPCFTIWVGNSSCQSDSALESQADTTCTLKKAKLKTFLADDKCGSSSSYKAEATCCD